MDSLAAALNNNKQQDETNKLLKAILKGQETDRKERKSAAAKANRMSALRKADVEPNKKPNMKEMFGQKSKSNNWLKDLLLKGLGLAAIGGTIAAYFKSDKFRGFVNNLLQKAILGENGIFGSKNRDRVWEWMKENPLKSIGAAAGALALLIGPKSLIYGAFTGLSKTIPLIAGGISTIVKALAAAGLLKVVAPAALLGSIPFVASGIKDKIRSNMSGGGNAAAALAASDKEEMDLNKKYQGKPGSKTGTRANWSEEDKKRDKQLKDFEAAVTKSNRLKDQQIQDSKKEIEGKGGSRSKQRKIDPVAKAKAEAEHQQRVKELAEKYNIKGFSKGGWITGPQSGYPVSLTGQGVDFIGHGTEYVAQRSNGGFVIPVDTPHTRQDATLTGRRMGEAMAMGFSAGGLIEHLHGDPIRKGYDHSHGTEGNAHDHMAFSSPELMRKVRDALSSGNTASGRSYQIGSQNDGKHAVGSYHYKDQAFDIPWSQFGSGKITERDHQQSRQLLADVKYILGDKSTPDSTPPNKNLGSLMKGLMGGNFAGGVKDLLSMDIGDMIDSIINSAMIGYQSIFSMFSGSSSLTPSGPKMNMGKDINEKLMNSAKLAMEAGFTKDQAKIMAAIAGGESSFNSKAFNGKGADKSYGLWQINMLGKMGPERRAMLGISSNEELFDPRVNARAAKMIYDQQGFGAWGAYTDGNANKYMDAAQKLQFSRGGRLSGIRTPMAGPDPNELLRDLNQKSTQSMNQIQPIIMPIQGGGGGGMQSSDEGTVPTIPAGIPNNPGNSFQMSLVMTRNLLSANIGG